MQGHENTNSGRRTVFSRVLLSYVVVTLSFALVAGYGVLGQRRSAQEIERIRTGYVPLSLALRDAVAGQNTYNSQLNNITEVRNPADKQVWFATSLSVGRPKVFAEVRSAISRAFDSQDESLGAELATEVTAIEQFLIDDKEALAQLFVALRAQAQAPAEGLRDTLVTRGTQALVLLRKLEGRVEVQLDRLTAEALSREAESRRILLFWAGFTIFFGAGVVLYARRLLRPLLTVTERARAVAQGDFTPRNVEVSDDEIGELALTFESMVSAIARVNKELVEAERLATIGKMAAQVTHEVRNPLSSIGLNLELLEDELRAAPRETKELCVAIQREVERLTELTEQYLSVARRNDIQLRFEDLSLVVGDAVAFIKPEMLHHEVRLIERLASDLPELMLDESQLRQVVHNLLRNARQAMPDGGAVTIETRRAGDALELVVSDQGPGVPEQVHARLFEPFFTTRAHGTGFGLAVSRQIVETHGGTIRCEQGCAQGAEFVVSFPLPAIENE